jgi:membrane fusion protein, multidrug efflux system
MNETVTVNPVAEPIEPGARRRRILLIIALIFAVIGMLWFLWEHFVLSVRERTDDAYVAGHQVIISSQLPGTVVEVLADNTARVEVGQVLVRLDPADAETALAQAEAALAQSVRLVRQQEAQVGQFDAATSVRELELARAQEDLARREPLSVDQAIAGEELRHARESVELARATLRQAQKQATSARALVDQGALGQNPMVLEARARYRNAWLAVQRNAIVSPVSGYVAQRSVQLGQRINPGQALLTVIALDDLWIDANFKEGQVRNLRLGQPVKIVSDLYGGSVEFEGEIAGLAAGTGSAFSLLPAQNASGNWIKVVQRIPVRITLNPDQLEKYPLRVGLSTTVTVDTHARDGAVLPVKGAVSRPATQVYLADSARADAAADAVIAGHSGQTR